MSLTWKTTHSDTALDGILFKRKLEQQIIKANLSGSPQPLSFDSHSNLHPQCSYIWLRSALQPTELWNLCKKTTKQQQKNHAKDIDELQRELQCSCLPSLAMGTSHPPVERIRSSGELHPLALRGVSSFLFVSIMFHGSPMTVTSTVSFSTMMLLGWQISCWWFAFGLVSKGRWSHYCVCGIDTFSLHFQPGKLGFVDVIIHMLSSRASSKGCQCLWMSLHWFQWDLRLGLWIQLWSKQRSCCRPPHVAF